MLSTSKELDGIRHSSSALYRHYADTCQEMYPLLNRAILENIIDTPHYAGFLALLDEVFQKGSMPSAERNTPERHIACVFMIDFIDHDTDKIIRASLDEPSCETCSASSRTLSREYGRLAERVRGNKNYTRLCSRIDLTQPVRSNTTIDALASFKFVSYFSSSIHDALVSAPQTCALRALHLKVHEALTLMRVMGEAARLSLLADSPSRKNLIREYFFARRADLESCLGQIAGMAGAMKNKRLIAAAGEFAADAREAVERATPVIELP